MREIFAGKVTIEDNRAKWIIKYSTKLPTEANLAICSPDFYVANQKWELKLYPNGFTFDKTGGWLGVGLRNKTASSNKPRGIPFNVKLAIIGEHGEEVLTFNLERDEDCVWYDVKRIIERKEFDCKKQQFSPNNFLVIVCEIWRDKTIQTETASHIDRHLQDYKTLLFSGRESDLTIKVQDKEFRVHKDILASRSPVLFSLLKLDKEVESLDFLTLEDIDPDIFPEFLHYLYIRSIGKVSSEKVITLYTVAENYQIKELKLDCMQYFKVNFTADKFCDFMSLFLKYNNKRAIEIATHFFLKNAKAVIATAKWKTFLIENTDVANGLLMKLLEAK